MRAYAPIFREQHIPRALAGAFVGRLSYGAVDLALLLSARQLTGSFAAGGTAVALFLAGAGLMAPARGRLVDRHGGTRVLLTLATAHAAALCALAGLVALDGPTPVLYASCAAAGLTVPPLVASLRNVLAATFDEGPERDTAYVLDAILEQTSFVVGPLVAGAAVALASPQAAVAATAAAILGGTCVFASAPPARAWRAHAAAATRRVALASPCLRVVALSFAAFGFATGTVSVAVPASATLAGSRDTAGLLLALLSAGSVAGGVVYGARVWRSAIGQRYVVVLWLFAAAMLALAAASTLVALGGVLLLTGCALAPATALVFGLVDAVAPAGMATESYTWVTSAELIGLAAGSTVAGAIVDGPGAPAAFLAGAGIALAGALVAWARRGTLLSAVAEAPAR